MKREKIIVLILGGLLCLTIIVSANGVQEASGSLDNPSYTLQFACAAADENEMGVFIHEIKDKLEQKSNGVFNVDLYPNAQLGGDRELLESCQAGNIAMVVQSTSPQVTFMPDLAVFDMPSVMTDLDKTFEALNGDFGAKVSEIYEKAGYKLLIIYPIAFREMTSNKKIASFNDFKGQKIRTMENPYHIAYWKALGANPTPLNFAELYISLKQGLIDAQENPAVAIIGSKLYEQQKYFINTNHIMFLTTVIMNKDLFDGMPVDYQTFLLDTVREAAANNIDLMKKNNEMNLQFLRDNGVEVIDLPSSVMAEMKEAAEPVYSMIREAVGDELVDYMLESLK